MESINSGAHNGAHNVAQKKLNPNAPTNLTRRCICWWTADGDSIAHICEMLCRTEKEVKQILNECRESGEYKAYNAMRRLSFDRKKRVPVRRGGHQTLDWRIQNEHINVDYLNVLF